MNVATTGLSEGDFHRLAVLHNGSMTKIISLIGSLGGGSVNSATAPLSISGVLSIDLSSYITSGAVNTLLANYRLTSALFDGVNVGSGMVAVKNGASLSLGLTGAESKTALKLADSQGNVRNLSSSLTGTLVWNTASVALTNDLVNKIDTFTVSAPLAVSGTGASRALSTLWTPTAVTVGSGLCALASDANGTLSLSLTGTESRTTLKIADSNGAVRDLTSSRGGVLTWNGTSLVNTTGMKSHIASSVYTSANSGLTV